jgi:zinc/manganese transport system substrate-binding protein
MRGVAAGVAVAGVVGLGLGGCATSLPGGGAGGGAGKAISVVAAESFWGSIASQLGGDRVHVTSVIANPNADPHDYEPTPRDGRAVATARLMIDNGVGYDPWAAGLVAANPSDARTTLTVGDLVGAKTGDNPHLWYNPADVRRAIDAITAAYTAIDPAGAAYFRGLHARFTTVTLRPYTDLIATIREEYGGTPVGASESVVAMLSPALGLRLITPPGFLRAVSEGTDPTAAEKSAIDTQISTRQIAVYIYNSQNATPDVARQVAAAKAAGIPVTTITETLTPAGTTFEQWQVAELTGLRAALARGGRA